MNFNQFFKFRRMKIGTVREFARKNGLDAAYVSRIENGITMPPKDIKKLSNLALALGIAEGTDEWQEFMDLAAVAKNELPADLKNDKRAAAMLPAFYRTLRNEKLDEDEVKELLKLIEESGKE